MEVNKPPEIENSPDIEKDVLVILPTINTDSASTKLIPFQTGKPKQKKSKNTTRAFIGNLLEEN